MICSMDAKSCYNRIVHSITSLALQRMGMPLPPIQCMFGTIQNMTHYIRTAYGDSEILIDRSNEESTFQGVLQGNGAGPSTWVCTNTPQLKVMRKKEFGVKMVTMISKEHDRMVGLVFVDDADLPEENLKVDTNTIDDIAISMQQAIDTWDDTLKTTGGVSGLAKSLVYTLSFAFKPNREVQYERIETLDIQLSVKDENNMRQPLTIVNADRGIETLGVCMAPDGNMADEKEKL